MSGPLAATGRPAVVGLGVALAVAVALMWGCTREVRHEQRPTAGEPVGWVTSEAASLRVLAINNQAVPVDHDDVFALREGGFTVALPPGRHALLCRLDRRNPYANQPGQPPRVPVGTPQWLVLDVREGAEAVVEPQVLGDGTWRLVVREVREPSAESIQP